MKLKSLLITLLGSMFFSAFALAEGPDQKTTNQRFKDWESICVETTAASQCRATQTLGNSQRQTVAVLNWYQPNANVTVFELAVPLMIDVQKGVTLSFDDGSNVKRNIRFCNNLACFVLGENDAELLASFKKGSVAALTFTPFNQADNQLRFSLQGFSAAFDSLKK
jgi:invasion protein IalB